MLAAAACGGDGGGGDGEETTDSTTPSTTTAPTTTLDEATRKEEAAQAAFLAYYDAFFEAAAEPVNPELPRLQELMTGDQQRIVTRNLEAMRTNGQATRLPANSQRRQDPRIVELQADGSVHVTSCEIDDSVVYDVNTGAVVNDDVVTNTISATLVEEAGQWKIVFSERTDTAPGMVACDF